MSGRNRRAVLGAAAVLPLLGCAITSLGQQNGDGGGGTGMPARRPPVRLGVGTGYLGDEQALAAWRAAAERLRETGGPEIAI